MSEPVQKVRISYPRRAKMDMGSTGINVFRKTRPWVAAWWSAALPGFGHMYLGMYIPGLILMSGEIGLNLLGGINLAILYTFTGQWHRIQESINYQGAIPYCSIFIFAIADSYRASVEINKHAFLESKQPVRGFQHSKVTQLDLNILDKRVPWVAALWSGAFAGMGHLYTHRIITGFILMGWYVAVVLMSKMGDLMIYTIFGPYDHIPQLVNYEWLLFFPSIYLYSMYDAYNHAIVYNQLFKDEQVDYLRNKYGKNPLMVTGSSDTQPHSPRLPDRSPDFTVP